MAKENVGNDSTISYKNGEEFTQFASVWDITSNKITTAQVDTTKLNSKAMESQQGTPDYGEVSVTISATPANTALINGWIAAKKTNTFKIETVDEDDNVAQGEEFDGWVKEFSPLGEEVKIDEPLRSKLVLKITGVPTFTGETTTTSMPISKPISS